MYQLYFLVYLVMSIVSAAPVPNDNYLSNVLQVSSEVTIDDGVGSCGFYFNSSDTYEAHKTFNDYTFDKTVSVIYLYLQEKSSDQIKLKQYLPEETYRNGLQEWIWLKRELMYEELSLPIDLDSLTYTITKYGTRQMDIPWSLSITCHLNSRISYENETKHILNYLWSSITKNETGSLLCHRSFDDKTLIGTKAIWILTTVWIGYDFDCFSIESLINGDFAVTEQTKYDITKILTVVLGLLAYMHPFIIHLVEIAQPDKKIEMDKYYNNKDQYEKPYGLTRIMQKIFFTPWNNSKIRTNKAVKYAPIVRFYFFWTLIIFGFNFYKLRINKHELFEKEEYDDFPTIYRYGIPEYHFFKTNSLFPFIVSILSYFVCNVWIYILYNESDDFIICFGKDTCCCSDCCSCCIRSKYICCVPVKDIMETEGSTDQDRWMLNASKKLIFRFTMLFSLQFWRFIFQYSFYSVLRVRQAEENYKYVILRAFVGTLLFIINIFVNILFCAMPAIWFIVYLLFSICLKKNTTKSTQTVNRVDSNRLATSTGSESKSTDSCCTWSCFLPFCGFVMYLFTVREHASFFVFIERSFAYTIIAGLTVSEHVWRWYLVVIFSFGYFASYILDFLDSYAVLLNIIFEIHEKDIENHPWCDEKDYKNVKIISKNSVDEDIFDYIVDNCYTARKKFFLLVIKTFLTTIFMVVSFQILQRTGRFDEMKFFNDTLSILVILISPKLVLFFTESNSAEEIHKHVADIETLYKKYSNKNNKGYDGDACDICDHCKYTCCKCTCCKCTCCKCTCCKCTCCKCTCCKCTCYKWKCTCCYFVFQLLNKSFFCCCFTERPKTDNGTQTTHSNTGELNVNSENIDTTRAVVHPTEITPILTQNSSYA